MNDWKIFFSEKIEKFTANREILLVVSVIFGILIFATLLFFIWGLISPHPILKELKTRTKAWWGMASIFLAATVFNPLISYVGLGLLSFAALRELSTISKNVRPEDRRVLIWCYMAIPIQYFLAYKGWHTFFLTFIPIGMFIWIPFMLILQGTTDGISRSMSVLPTQLMFTVFGVSHLAYMLSLPELEGFTPGGRGLLLFIVFITEMNDVFQFTWGKMLGRFKILPKISPNKTWEGFIGGMLTTAVVGYFMRFLTPMSGLEAMIVSAGCAAFGFIGDVTVSAIKRDIGVKDASDVIPGHGGILDRINSLAITGPVFFHIMYHLHYVKPI